MISSCKVMYVAVFAIFVATNVQASDERERIEWVDVFVTGVNSDIKMPRILFIGDSIAREYSKDLAKKTSTKFYVSRLASSYSVKESRLLSQVEEILSNNSFDMIIFNNGLHSLSLTNLAYLDSIIKIHALLGKYSGNSKMMWVSSTYNNSINGNLANDKIAKFNIVAGEYFEKNSIPTCDLASRSSLIGKEYLGDGIHFTKFGYSDLANEVMVCICKHLVC